MNLGDALANAGRGAEAAAVYLEAGATAPRAQARELAPCGFSVLHLGVPERRPGGVSPGAGRDRHAAAGNAPRHIGRAPVLPDPASPPRPAIPTARSGRTARPGPRAAGHHRVRSHGLQYESSLAGRLVPGTEPAAGALQRGSRADRVSDVLGGRLPLAFRRPRLAADGTAVGAGRDAGGTGPRPPRA